MACAIAWNRFQHETLLLAVACHSVQRFSTLQIWLKTPLSDAHLREEGPYFSRREGQPHRQTNGAARYVRHVHGYPQASCVWAPLFRFFADKLFWSPMPMRSGLCGMWPHRVEQLQQKPPNLVFFHPTATVVTGVWLAWWAHVSERVRVVRVWIHRCTFDTSFYEPCLALVTHLVNALQPLLLFCYPKWGTVLPSATSEVLLVHEYLGGVVSDHARRRKKSNLATSLMSVKDNLLLKWPACRAAHRSTHWKETCDPFLARGHVRVHVHKTWHVLYSRTWSASSKLAFTSLRYIVVHFVVHGGKHSRQSSGVLLNIGWNLEHWSMRVMASAVGFCFSQVEPTLNS